MTLSWHMWVLICSIAEQLCAGWFFCSTSVHLHCHSTSICQYSLLPASRVWAGYSFPAAQMCADMVHCNMTLVTIIFCILLVVLCHLKYCYMQLLNGLCRLYVCS